MLLINYLFLNLTLFCPLN